jgi:hypothetical protein
LAEGTRRFRDGRGWEKKARARGLGFTAPSRLRLPEGWDLSLRGFAPDEKTSIARKLPGFKEQLLGGFQQRLVQIRTGVEKTDFDGTDILLDLGKQLLDFLFLARIAAKGVKLSAPGLQLLSKRLGFFSVAPGYANFVSTLGKASRNSGADSIAGSNQKSNSV